MTIWLTRHGQTNLNKQHLMQGRTDEPLNETGRAQARAARAELGHLHFDAVYASPLQRAVETGAIIGDVPMAAVIRDERLIEADFGRFEKEYYWKMSLPMSLYWALPELFPCPEKDGVESIASLVARSRSFLLELEQKEYEHVLIACHGGIMRALSGCLMDRKNGIYWRPKPRNCEIRVFQVEDGKHHYLRDLRLPKAAGRAEASEFRGQ